MTTQPKPQPNPEGRPPKFGRRMKPTNLTLDDETLRILRAIGPDLSAAVRSLAAAWEKEQNAK